MFSILKITVISLWHQLAVLQWPLEHLMRLSVLRCGALLLLLLTVSRQHFKKLTQKRVLCPGTCRLLQTLREGAKNAEERRSQGTSLSLWDLWSVSSPRQSREPQGSVSAQTRGVGGGRVLKQNKLFGELTAAKPL